MNSFINDLRKVPVLRILLPYTAGILLDQYSEWGQLPGWSLIPYILLILQCIILLIAKSPHRMILKGLQSAGFVILFVLAGYLNSKVSEPETPGVMSGSTIIVSGHLLTDIVEKENSWVTIMETGLWCINDSVLYDRQKVRLYIMKDSLPCLMSAGQEWICRGNLQPIRNSGNPGEFDYAGYMQRQGVWNTLFVSHLSTRRLIDDKGTRLRFIPGKISSKIRAAWNPGDPGMAVLSAITLGDKSLLTKESRNAYAGSGAMHLLAVSGLHVGMIWYILDMILIFPRRKKVFKILKVVVILSILWIYAGMTGFSDSVTRSVTMFSMVALSKFVSRTPNIFNTLFLSGFILLLLEPMRLFEPGFQLSYLALFGIVTIYPRLAGIKEIRNKFLRKVVDLVYVSIAAQLSTLPLSLLYFGRFPVYFILTNLVAIPLVSILLALFVLFAPFFILGIWPDIFYQVLLEITRILNLAIHTVSALPGASIENIHITPLCSFFLLILIFTIAGLWWYKRVIWVVLSALSLCLLLVISGIQQHVRWSANTLTVCNFPDCTALTAIDSGRARSYLLYKDKKPGEFVYDYLKSKVEMGAKVNSIYEISEDSGESQKFNLHSLCMGAWALEESGFKVLICGSCTGTDLIKILGSCRWDMVIFRSGTPYLGKEHVALLTQTRCIADGTVRKYEIDRLSRELPQLFLTSFEGAYTINTH